MTPSLEAIQQLDGKLYAMLSPQEEEVLEFFVQQGRKFDVAVSVTNEAQVMDLQAAGSSHAARTLLKHSNARLTIRLGPTASLRYEQLDTRAAAPSTPQQPTRPNQSDMERT